MEISGVLGQFALAALALRKQNSSVARGLRLACQALVQRSAIVLTKPQTGLLIVTAKLLPHSPELPAGPTAWPVVEVDEDDADESADANVVSSAEAGVEADAAPVTRG